MAAKPESKYHISISPPLVNSASPWASTKEDLKALYDCPYTGAVTIRTSLWNAFQQTPTTNQYTFLSTSTGHATSKIDVVSTPEGRGEVLPGETSSLNTLGYSPISFIAYCKMLTAMATAGELKASPVKPFIVSVTGDANEVRIMSSHLAMLHNEPADYPKWPKDDSEKKYRGLDILMEINLSCPNIPGKEPPAYDGVSLSEYIKAVTQSKRSDSMFHLPFHVGIKTPPYTHHDQFRTLIKALEDSASREGSCPISFLTATNTLGSCLVLNEKGEPALGSANGTGVGGLAGDAIHPIALGNVRTLRVMLDASQHASVRGIAIVGTGGVKDSAGFRRMKRVGASIVGVGTALGREGVSIFETISSGLSDEEKV